MFDSSLNVKICSLDNEIKLTIDKILQPYLLFKSFASFPIILVLPVAVPDDSKITSFS